MLLFFPFGYKLTIYLLESNQSISASFEMAPIDNLTTKSAAEAAAAQELLQAQSHVFHLAMAHSGTMSLKCAVQLDIPDIIHRHGGKPLPLSVLVAQLPIPAAKSSCVRRLMRLLAHMKFFTIEKGADDEDDAYSLTANSKIFLKDSPASLAPWLLGVRSPDMTDPWQTMSEWFKQDRHQSLFEMHHGKSIWDLANEKPEFNRLFNDTMASDTRVLMTGIVSGCPHAFEGVGTLVDVGGGNGATARAIAEAFPRIKCTVYDLPHVVATIPNSPLVEAVGGDMFESVPKADVVFMKLILHDWNHEDCVKILKNCKKAIPPKEEGGKVIIVDIVVNATGDDSTITDTKLWWDLVMMMSTEGKEREEVEWEKIFKDAGYSDYKITPLGIRSLIEVFP